MNAVHVDLWPYRNGCGKKKRLYRRTISNVISINSTTPPPPRLTLFHGGGMNLLVRTGEYNIDFGRRR